MQGKGYLLTICFISDSKPDTSHTEELLSFESYQELFKKSEKKQVW